MGRRFRRHEEHTNHEAWAIPYGDLVTLLLAFFVVMYAMSSVNEGKYRVLSDSLFAAFRGVPRTEQPIQVGEKQVGSGADIKTSIVQQAVLEGQPRSLLEPLPIKLPPKPQAVEDKRDDPAIARAAAARAALAQMADQVERALGDLVRANQVVIRRTDNWIEVEFRTDILFGSGSARMGAGAVGVIEQLAAALAPYPNPIRVEGHTDNVPIHTREFNSNWELSAERAVGVLQVLAAHGVAPGRLAIVGFGDQQPLASNDTPEGRNANRRVVVVILSTEATLPADPTLPRAAPAATAAADRSEAASPAAATGRSAAPASVAAAAAAPSGGAAQAPAAAVSAAASSAPESAAARTPLQPASAHGAAPTGMFPAR
jgi:chemotaxis protein MotB